jgi:hypothetical protein
VHDSGERQTDALTPSNHILHTWGSESQVLQHSQIHEIDLHLHGDHTATFAQLPETQFAFQETGQSASSTAKPYSDFCKEHTASHFRRLEVQKSSHVADQEKANDSRPAPTFQHTHEAFAIVEDPILSFSEHHMSQSAV